MDVGSNLLQWQALLSATKMSFDDKLLNEEDFIEILEKSPQTDRRLQNVNKLK